jgi:isopentenyl phosphate kinase
LLGILNDDVLTGGMKEKLEKCGKIENNSIYNAINAK